MKRTFLGLIFFSGAVFADPRVGNGGGTWVCSDRETRTNRWIQLLDLFEIQNEYNLEPDSVAGDPWVIYETKMRIVSKLPELSSPETAAQLKARIQIIPPTAKLELIDDAFFRVRPTPDSCSNGILDNVQLANFTPDGRLLIAPALWNDPAFGQRAQAALFVHEAVYKILRERYQEQDSSRTREIVSLLFSTLKETEVLERINAVMSAVEVKAAPVTCVAEVKPSPAAGFSRRFTLNGGIDRATIAIAGFEFSVDVDSEGRPQAMQIADSTKRVRNEAGSALTLVSGTGIASLDCGPPL